MNTSYWPIHAPKPTSGLLSQLARVWQSLVAHLDATTEPRVWQVHTGSGETLWNAYDPISQVAINHASADELRIWLEELHYRN